LPPEVLSSLEIDLNWDDNSYNEDGFKIERSIGIPDVDVSLVTYNGDNVSPEIHEKTQLTVLIMVH